MSKTGGGDLSFELAIKRLDEIVASLDSGVLSLDDSLALFAEGAGLVTFCNKSLEDAKLRLNELFPVEEPK
ncbi:MAG: exodeoxyribonuclease VII small subunit [Oscillospiraceae bacterium]|nr:exodeoxyribonuclease VII small subunit [Oscillospiraceae bacterium]